MKTKKQLLTPDEVAEAVLELAALTTTGGERILE